MKRFYAGIFLIIFSGACGLSWAQNEIIKDVRGEIDEGSAEIIIEANCDLDYIDYTLQNPPRIIVDPIGKVYSDLKDTISFEKGLIKKVTLIKGKTEEKMTGNFYPLDFISIELANKQPYKIKRGKQEIAVTLGKKKETEPQKFVPAAETQEAVYEPAAPQQATTQPVEATKEEAVQLSKIGAPPAEKGYKAEAEAVEVIPLNEPEKTEAAQPAAPVPGNVIYKIGEGDALDISVWQHPELDKRVLVRPDGYISFPLVGDINATGLTPPQLSSNIKENLSRMLRDPQVTVIVLSFGSKNIFVLGEVAKPGIYPYRGGINVLDAISGAGGWKNSAVLNSVMLVRKAFTDAPEVHRLDVYALVKKGDFNQNLSLNQGDIIFVPQSFVANIGNFLDNLKVSLSAGASIVQNRGTIRSD